MPYVHHKRPDNVGLDQVFVVSDPHLLYEILRLVTLFTKTIFPFKDVMLKPCITRRFAFLLFFSCDLSYVKCSESVSIHPVESRALQLL